MNYFSLIDEIKQVSLRYSEEFYEGDIYEYLNSGNHKYPCIILTVQNITTDDDVNTISATIFAVDRLTNDSSNKLEVQSLCMSKITQILGTLEERVSSIQSNTLTPFTEKFSDLCGGMYGEFTLEYIGDGVCDEGLQYKEIELTNNGIYDIIGYDKAIVNVVNREEIERLEQKIDELESTIDTVTSISITENGTYTAPEGVLGYNTIEVNSKGEMPTLVCNNGVRLACNNETLPFKLYTSGMTDFNNMFTNCKQFTTIPLIDTSKGTNFSKMFGSCSSLTTIPLLDTSSGTNFGSMFYQCQKLTSIPQLDTSKGTSLSNMFEYCYSLTTIPQLDTSKSTSFSYMFYFCNKLTSIPQLDTSNSNNFSYMFHQCSSLTTIPQLNTSKGTNFSYMFYSCKQLTTIPQLDTSEGKNFNYMFYDCQSLQSIQQLDFSKATIFTNPFYKCTLLTDITFIGSINASIDFSYSPLNEDSVESILSACANTTNSNSKTLKFKTGTTITDTEGTITDLIAICNSKGWTISGLTLQ